MWRLKCVQADSLLTLLSSLESELCTAWIFSLYLWPVSVGFVVKAVSVCGHSDTYSPIPTLHYIISLSLRALRSTDDLLSSAVGVSVPLYVSL